MTMRKTSAGALPITALLFGSCVSLAILLASAAGSTARAEEPQPLKLCFDPDNLPFSNAAVDRPGIYNEIGDLLSKDLGRPVEAVWALTYFGKRAVRTTLLAKQCDASIGLPAEKSFMGPRVIFTKPLFQIGYALVTRKPLAGPSFATLAGKRVGVQFNSGPQSLLALHDDITKVTFLEPQEAMKALADGAIDAAFIWGPIAGYLNKTAYDGAFTIVPVAGEGMQWPAAVGFAKSQAALRDAVDAVLVKEADQIAALKVKYGLPDTPPVELAEAAPAAFPVIKTAAAAPDPAPPTEPPQAEPASVHPSQGDVASGHDLFNGTCAHCHGPDAIQSERRINLRLLQHRYAEKMDEVFQTTVTHGRVEKGMPNWTDVFTEEQFRDILSYLHTVQAP